MSTQPSDGISVLGKEIMLFIAIIFLSLSAISIPAGWPIWLTFVFALLGVIGGAMRVAFHLPSSSTSSSGSS